MLFVFLTGMEISSNSSLVRNGSARIPDSTGARQLNQGLLYTLSRISPKRAIVIAAPPFPSSATIAPSHLGRLIEASSGKILNFTQRCGMQNHEIKVLTARCLYAATEMVRH